MSVRKHTWPVHGDQAASIEVRNPAGSVVVEAAEGADSIDVQVEALDEAAEQLLDRVEIDGSPADLDRVGGPVRIRVVVPERRVFRSPAFAVRVATPPDAALRVAVASADVELTGRLGRLELTSASGDLAVEQCTELQARNAGGDIRVGIVAGRATIGTASGDVRLDRVDGDLEARTASGDVAVAVAGGNVSLGTASGDVGVDALSGGRAQVKTVSGDVEIGIVPGLRVWLDLSTVSGRMESQLDDDVSSAGTTAELTLALRSVSGDLRVRRAAFSS